MCHRSSALLRAQPPEPAEAGNLALFTVRLEDAAGPPQADYRPAWRKSLPELYYGLPVYNWFRLRIEEAFWGG